jgi:hypothetical protein
MNLLCHTGEVTEKKLLLTSSGAIATLVPHETSSLVASTLYIASTDVHAAGIPSVTPAHVLAPSGDAAAPAAFRVASSGDTVGSGKKRPMNETEWQEFCRGWPEIWSSPAKIQRWEEEYDRTH